VKKRGILRIGQCALFGKLADYNSLQYTKKNGMTRLKTELKSRGKKTKNKVVPGAPKKASSRNGAELVRQFKRTKLLNLLASEINRVIGTYCEQYKPSDFYQRLQALFRKEVSDNRLLLLWELKGIEINPRYPSSKLGTTKQMVTTVKNSIVVNLQVESRPTHGKYNADCYCYEVILFCWDKSKRPATHFRQYSDWVELRDGFPEFEFLFPKPKEATHWLLCLKQQLGVDREAIGAHVAKGVIIAEVGTFNKKDQELLNEKIAAQNKQQAPKEIKRKADDVVRVKAKKIRKDEIVSPK
jgi:hypothetical protein